MEFDKKRITELTLRYVRQEISPEEKIELQEWLDASPINRKRFEQRIRAENLLEGIALWQEAEERAPAFDAMMGKRLEETSPIHKRVLFLNGRWGSLVVAASVLAVAVGATWLWSMHGTRRVPQGPPANIAADLAPGGNKAMLTLSTGATIVLDNAENGALARQGNTKVVKLDSGEIAYQSPVTAGREILYNSISTPKGGQYKLILSDGTKVWINAATVLRYPIAFSGATRTIELTKGEAYFEIAHDASRPFIVQVPAMHPGDKDLSVQVLGTSFDVNAYQDEPDTKTTLLTGAIKVTKGAKAVVLQPGQQAQITANSESIIVSSSIDATGAVAWKDGMFSFDRAGTEAVMRQLARWYDVEVTYEGVIPVRQFVGTVPRNVPVSYVLKGLEYNDVHFKIEGKKIIVTP